MREPDIEATIGFLTPEEGGRDKPVFGWFSPYFTLDGTNHEALFEYPDVDRIDPGDTVRSLIRFLHPRLLAHLAPGTTFQIREASRVIGSGLITRAIGLYESAQADSALNSGNGA
jgi:translation elongation factor EF-Tu-like GTPase